MKSKLLFSLLLSFSTVAAEFVHDEEMVKSAVSEKLLDCGNYQVIFRQDVFPFKYEKIIPQELKINEFYGSSAIVSMDAVVVPGNTTLPNPHELPELNGFLLVDRTYLPSKGTCKDNKLIISYWSGGNCSGCQAFVEFEVIDNVLTNPRKVSYSYFNKFSK